MRIGFDLDGVCYDFGASVKQFIAEVDPLMWVVDHDFNKPVTDWHFYREWGFTDEGFLNLCHDGVDAGIIFSHGDPHPGSVEVMNRVYDMGHKVVIITDRPFGKNGGKNSRRATFRWLKQHGFKFHEVHFTAEKTTVPVDMMIDDKLENYDDLDAAGTEVYLLNRAWNQVGPDHRRRIDSTSEYLALVEEKTYAFA